MTPNRRLELAARRNKGRQLIAPLRDRLSRALDTSVELSALLDLDESDRLFSEFRTRVKECQEQRSNCLTKRLDRGQPPFELALVNEVAHALGDTTVILFPEGWEYTGAVRLQAAAVLRGALHLVEPDGEEIRIMTPDGSSGLLLERYTERVLGRSGDVFKLWLWGEPWLSRVRSR